MNFGKQKGKVAGLYPGVHETSGNVFVNCVFLLETGEKVYSKIYITEKSKTLARARLKKCGFDSDVADLADLEVVPNCLDGTEVELDIYEEEYMGKPQLRVDIVTERPKAEASALKSAGSLLRSAKKPDEPHPAEGKKVIPGFGKQPKPKPEQKAEEVPASPTGPEDADIPF